MFIILGEPFDDFSACHLRPLNLKLFYVPIIFCEKEFDSWLTKHHCWETYQYTLWKPQVQTFQFAIEAMDAARRRLTQDRKENTQLFRTIMLLQEQAIEL